MDNDELIEEVKKELVNIKKVFNKKMDLSCGLFDFLKNKIDKLESGMTVKSSVQKDFIICDGKKFVCSLFYERKECVVTKKIRQAGFDVCFLSGIQCAHLKKI